MRSFFENQKQKQNILMEIGHNIDLRTFIYEISFFKIKNPKQKIKKKICDKLFCSKKLYKILRTFIYNKIRYEII